MERFENTIFKQRKEINGRITKMFRLLKELTTNKTPEKVLIREEAKFPVTKNINSISLTKREEERSNRTKVIPDNTEKLTEIETEMPVVEVEKIMEVENLAKSIKTSENEEAVEAPDSITLGQEPEPAYDAIVKKKITKKEDVKGNFEIPCSIEDLKHVNTLVDQGSDVNVMPYSTYIRLTDERRAETNISLIHELATQNEKRPFIFGTPLMATATTTIKFDTSTITLRPGKSKVSFHRISDSSYITDKGVKNDIEPIAPIMTVNRLVLEWEERIKLYLEKEMKFNQWRSNNFKNKQLAPVKVEGGMDDKGEVM
ncbi:hypothetical protein Tco_0666643 [Tanacetum coccineum]